jgi:hypothetical protein
MNNKRKMKKKKRVVENENVIFFSLKNWRTGE